MSLQDGTDGDGNENMINIELCKKCLKEVWNESDEDREAKWKEKEQEYLDKFANPYGAAARGFIDEVILPEQTRLKLIKAYAMLENKQVASPKRKHGNIPL